MGIKAEGHFFYLIVVGEREERVGKERQIKQGATEMERRRNKRITEESCVKRD